MLKGSLVGTFRPAQLVTRTFSKAQPRQEPPRHIDSATAFKQRLVGWEYLDPRWQRDPEL